MKSAQRPLSVFNRKGFTLVELLVALTVTSIIFTAVATLAYALGTANEISDDTSWKQAQVRYATLRISELIRHCKLICGTPGDDLAVWRADDNDDGQINVNELVYIERGPNRDYLQLCEFSSSNNPTMTLGEIKEPTKKGILKNNYNFTETLMIPQCSDVEFRFDVLPPNSKFVSISFDLIENDVVREYQVNAAVRGWAGHLLDGSDNIISDDD